MFIVERHAVSNTYLTLDVRIDAKIDVDNGIDDADAGGIMLILVMILIVSLILISMLMLIRTWY